MDRDALETRVRELEDPGGPADRQKRTSGDSNPATSS